MRKVILGVAVSLDGFIEGPNGEYDWCFTDQDYGMSDFVNRIDAVFYGRKSYEMMLKAGPELANPFGHKKSYVFSNTLTKPYEGTELISGNIKEQVEALKRMPGKDIWLFGGAILTTTFINEGLVDELSLAVHPILLGAGTSLFMNMDGRKHVKLIDSKTYSTGLVMLNYEVNKK
ncbi:MAG TPA: dihydrofolate reductase family protein [Cyclobacteriaceae bacterium]